MGAATSNPSEHHHHGNSPDLTDPRLKDRFALLAASCKTPETIPGDFLVKLLALPHAEDFGARLCRFVGHDPSTEFTLAIYSQIVSCALGLVGSGPTVSRNLFFSRMFSEGRDVITRDELIALATVLQSAAMDLYFSTRSPSDTQNTELVVSIADGILRDRPHVAVEEVDQWCSANAPYLFSALTHFIEVQCLSHVSEEDTREQHHLPLLISHEGFKTAVVSHPMSWVLSSCLPEPFRKSPSWSLLYSSNVHGYGTGQFFLHVLNYQSPTVMFIRDTAGGVVVVCVDSQWHDDYIRPWGGPNCKIFTLLPKFSMYHSSVSVGVDLKTRHVPHGIAVGPSATKKDCMLWVESDLTTGILRCDPGLPAGTARDFSILTIEVWGCGLPEAAAKQALETARDRRTAEQRQQIRNPGDWLENPDRFLLELAGLSVDQTSRISSKTR